jgi:hypothetical protein
MVGGVIRLGGRGPFQAFIFIGSLGRRKTGGEDDAGLPPPAGFTVLVGDEDRARCPPEVAASFFPGGPTTGVSTGPIGGKTSRRRSLDAGVTHAVSIASVIASS